MLMIERRIPHLLIFSPSLKSRIGSRSIPKPL